MKLNCLLLQMSFYHYRYSVDFIIATMHFLKVDWTAYRVFSRDVTAAMLVSLNKETAAMLPPTNPPGFELNSYANVFFCFG